MAETKLEKPVIISSNRTNLLLPIAFLWGFIIIFILAYLAIDSGINSPETKFYLLPWTFLTGAVVMAPSIYLYFKKQFNLFHPLVFAAWIYFFPAFFIGGLILSSGLANPYFLALVQNERYDLPMTLVYVMLGYAGLSIGFFLPLGRRLGELIKNRLPVINWSAEQLLKPSLLLLGLGLINTFIAFSVGLLGYQRADETGAFDGVVSMFTFFWLESTFLIWMCIFRTQKLHFRHYLVIAIVLFTSLSKSAVQGNRGSLVQVFVLIAASFILSGRKIQLKHKVTGGILLFGALLFGMIYGTTFRTIKTSQDKVSMEQYMSDVFQTFEKISDQDLGANLEQGLAAMGERLENVSQLAVVVSNYETFANYEAGYGLDNNIIKDSISFLIPRFIWQEKSVATDPYKYSDLYFNYGENSFTLTPMGDLLRNFGPFGVPIGMMFLGILIRIIYASLLEDQEFSYWRATLYYMLIMGISYEGSFGLILPYVSRVGLVSVIGLFIVWFCVRLFKNNQLRTRAF